MTPFQIAASPDADDTTRAFELVRGEIAVLRNHDERCILTLELLESSYVGNVEKASLRYLLIGGTEISFSIERLEIEYQVEQVNRETQNLFCIDGSDTFVHAPFNLKWSYSSPISIWIYPESSIEFAVAKSEKYRPSGSAIRRYITSWFAERYRLRSPLDQTDEGRTNG